MRPENPYTSDELIGYTINIKIAEDQGKLWGVSNFEDHPWSEDKLDHLDIGIIPDVPHVSAIFAAGVQENDWKNEIPKQDLNSSELLKFKAISWRE